jgi:hypothetical protein
MEGIPARVDAVMLGAGGVSRDVSEGWLRGFSRVRALAEVSAKARLMPRRGIWREGEWDESSEAVRV